MLRLAVRLLWIIKRQPTAQTQVALIAKNNFFLILIHDMGITQETILILASRSCSTK